MPLSIGRIKFQYALVTDINAITKAQEHARNDNLKSMLNGRVYDIFLYVLKAFKPNETYTVIN